MKDFLKLTICFGACLALNARLHAESVPLTGNPYTMVIARNIFGLLPPPPPDTITVPVEPPVKITLNGIMSVYGRLQALFKVAGKAPGKNDSYILSEGQRQDDIEVTKIDEKKGEVTFNNHGQEQVLPLAAPTASSFPALADAAVGVNPVAMPGGIPVAPMAGAFGSSGFNTTFGARPATGGSTPAAVNGSNLRPVPIRNNSFIQQPQTSMSQPEAVVAIEVNRELTKQQVLEGNMPPLPPTEITPDDATSVGGRPLVAPPLGAP